MQSRFEKLVQWVAMAKEKPKQEKDAKDERFFLQKLLIKGKHGNEWTPLSLHEHAIAKMAKATQYNHLIFIICRWCCWWLSICFSTGFSLWTSSISYISKLRFTSSAYKHQTWIFNEHKTNIYITSTMAFSSRTKQHFHCVYFVFYILSVYVI